MAPRGQALTEGASVFLVVGALRVAFVKDAARSRIRDGVQLYAALVGWAVAVSFGRAAQLLWAYSRFEAVDPNGSPGGTRTRPSRVSAFGYAVAGVAALIAARIDPMVWVTTSATKETEISLIALALQLLLFAVMQSPRLSPGTFSVPEAVHLSQLTAVTIFALYLFVSEGFVMPALPDEVRLDWLMIRLTGCLVLYGFTMVALPVAHFAFSHIFRPNFSQSRTSLSTPTSTTQGEPRFTGDLEKLWRISSKSGIGNSPLRILQWIWVIVVSAAAAFIFLTVPFAHLPTEQTERMALAWPLLSRLLPGSTTATAHTYVQDGSVTAAEFFVAYLATSSRRSYLFVFWLAVAPVSCLLIGFGAWYSLRRRAEDGVRELQLEVFRAEKRVRSSAVLVEPLLTEEQPNPSQDGEAADGRCPENFPRRTNSNFAVLTTYRKMFHFLAAALFIPALSERELPLLTFGFFAVLIVLIALEIARKTRAPVVAPLIDAYSSNLVESKDRGTLLLPHFFLLFGLATPLVIETYRHYFLAGQVAFLSVGVMHVAAASQGVLTVGIADGVAAVVGSRIGSVRLPGMDKKSLEGMIAFFLSYMVGSILIGFFAWSEIACGSAGESSSMFSHCREVAVKFFEAATAGQASGLAVFLISSLIAGAGGALFESYTTARDNLAAPLVSYSLFRVSAAALG